MKSLSKFLGLILRHNPSVIGISLDKQGWANVDELIEGVRNSGKEVDFNIIEKIVKGDGKKVRYVFNDDKTKIRAMQGHNKDLDVDLEFVAEIPPEILYHGAPSDKVQLILNDGLRPMSRQHVHLSVETDTANDVASRYSKFGKPTILVVDTVSMLNEGYDFYQADNGVWLADFVPGKFISSLN